MGFPAWPWPQRYDVAEPLECPLCGSHDVRAAIRDRAVSVDDAVVGTSDSLTYGLVATCCECGLEWKPGT